MLASLWYSVTQYRALWPSSGNSADRSLPPKMACSSRPSLTSATVLRAPSKFTTNSLKKAGESLTSTPGQRGQAPGGVVRAGDAGLAELA